MPALHHGSIFKRDPADEIDAATDSVATNQAHIAESATSPGIVSSSYAGKQSVKEVLEEDALANIDMRTLVFDFGPFAKLERRLHDVAREMADPDVADAFISHARQALHDACFSNDSLSKPASSESGLLARVQALDAAYQGVMMGNCAVLSANLAKAGLREASSVHNAIAGVIKSERDMLKRMERELVPPTLGGVLMQLLRGVGQHLEERNSLIGNARLTRNNQLVSALNDLRDASSELRLNSGDADWERSHGATAVRAVNELQERIIKLTRGVEDQVDSRALRAALDGVSSDLAVAEDKAATDEHKSKMSKLIEDLRQMVAEFINKLGAMFGKPPKSQSPSPTATH